MTVDITIDLGKLQDVDPEVARGVLQEQIRQAILEAVNEIADLIVQLAKQAVPVDTGTLQRSIRKEFAGELVSVIAGGVEFINPKTGKPCDYAPHVENYQPFMKIALESAKGELVEKIKQKVNERLSAVM